MNTQGLWSKLQQIFSLLSGGSLVSNTTADITISTKAYSSRPRRAWTLGRVAYQNLVINFNPLHKGSHIGCIQFLVPRQFWWSQADIFSKPGSNFIAIPIRWWGRKKLHTCKRDATKRKPSPSSKICSFWINAIKSYPDVPQKSNGVVYVDDELTQGGTETPFSYWQAKNRLSLICILFYVRWTKN